MRNTLDNGRAKTQDIRLCYVVELFCGVGVVVQQASSSGFIAQIRVEIRPQAILHRDSSDALSRHMEMTPTANPIQM